MTGHANDTDGLLERAGQGDPESWGALLTQHRARLRRMVALRMDPRLQGRLDPSDVIQEACLEASDRLPEYLRDRTLPFWLWLRLLTAQKLAILHRHHLGAQMRDAGREVPLHAAAGPATSSVSLANHLIGDDTRPSEAASRAEQKLRLQEALESMDPLDREVLALRHFEQLSRAEIAQVLGIQEAAAGKRYIRALNRLEKVLGNLSPDAGGPPP